VRTAGWDGARRILAVRLDGVGDVLMTTPALRALRSVPGTRVTLLTSTAGSRVAALVPDVDATIVYDAPWMKHGQRAGPATDRSTTDRLAAAGFDGAVIFTVFTQSPLPAALTCWLAGIPMRAAHCRENPYALLTDWIPDPEPVAGIRHEVRRQLDLVASLGRTADDERLSLAVPTDARARVDRVLGDLRLDGERPWVAIHPGANAPSRRYPAERFAEIARRLERQDVRVVFTGSGDDRGLADGVRAAAGAGTSLAGALDLAELAGLLTRASAVVTNNTGPAHIAAAVGTPVVDLYAYTNPQHVPWRVPSRVLYQDVPCRNCFKSICPMGHHACLRGVPVERVVAAVGELLEQAAPSRRAAALVRPRVMRTRNPPQHENDGLSHTAPG
jgi:lipopolysaccharide heptosyltransferase II